MASNFPTSVDNTPDVADGVDVVEAADVNTPKDTGEAAQTALGALGKSQANATDIVEQLVATLPTIKLSYVDGDTIQASAGVIWCENSGSSIRVPRQNTSTTNITFSDIDTGSEASDTTYYVWASADATASTVAFKISTSASTPSGLTTYRLVGGFYNDGSSDVIESTVWSVAGRKLINTASNLTGDRVSGTGTMVLDNTKPQSSEGNDLTVDLDFVPQSATSILEIRLIISAFDGPTGTRLVALFKDSDTDAINAIAAQPASNDPLNMILIHRMVSGTASKITFKARFGSVSAGTAEVNAVDATQVFGGVCLSGLIIDEYEA